MTTFVFAFLASHGLMLLAGVTAMLLAGTVAARLQRSPIHRQRIGELTLLCALAWLVVACIPLPRWHGWASRQPQETVTAETLLPTGHATEFPRVDRAELARLTAQLNHPVPQATPVIQTQTIPSPTVLPKKIPFEFVSVVAYLAGASLALLWLLLGHLLLLRITFTASAPSRWLHELLAELMRETGGRTPRLLVSSHCDRAFSCGLLRPTIVLGRRCADTASASQLRQILLHELAHVRQRDAWGNALFNLAMPVLFFHPLYWHLRGQVSLGRELIADDWAAGHGSRSAYARDLLAFAKTRSARRHVAGAVGLFQSTTHFYRRIHMLVQRDHALSTQCSTLWRLGTISLCGIAMTVGAFTLGVRPAAAQTAKEQAVKETKTIEAKPVDDPDQAKDPTKDDERWELQQQLENARRQMEKMKQQIQQMQIQQKEQEQAFRQKMEAMAKQGDARAREEFEKAIADHQRMAEKQQLQAEEAAKRTTAAYENAYAQKMRDQQTQMEKMQQMLAANGRGEGAFPRGNGAGDVARGVDSHVDLVNLANSYVDAIGAVTIAKARLGRGASDPGEQAVAEATLATAVRKAELLQRIAEVEREQAEIQLQRAEKLVKAGAMSDGEFREAQAKVRILGLILGSENRGKEGRNYDKGNEAVR